MAAVPLVEPTTQYPSASDDFMRLEVSEEEAAEFSFDVPPVPTESFNSIKTAGGETHSMATNTSGEDTVMDTDAVQMSSFSRNGDSTEVMEEDDDFGSALVVESPPFIDPVPSDPPSMLAMLYRSLVMDLGASPVLVPRYRLDTLHIRGVDEMSTEDVLRYFGLYKPKKVEWVNDTSCNVVFPSDLLAGTALKDLTSPLRVTKRPLPVQVGIPGAIQQPVCDGDTGEAIFISDVISFPIPVPQGTWRVAKAHPSNTKQMIFRYARTIDKKPQNAQKFSQYYNKYGNPNLSGLPKQDVENRRERVRAKKISSDSLEDREPFGLSVKPEVLEVEQPSRMRRQVGLYADRRDVSPYSRPRVDERVDARNSGYTEDLRSLLEIRGSPMVGDLRGRIHHTDSQPIVVRSSSDLRNRLNEQRGSQ